MSVCLTSTPSMAPHIENTLGLHTNMPFFQYKNKLIQNTIIELYLMANTIDYPQLLYIKC